jgi:hypothetical protein
VWLTASQGKAKPLVPKSPAALLYALYRFSNNSGNLAIFAAILRASSSVSSLAAERRPGLAHRVKLPNMILEER